MACKKPKLDIEIPQGLADLACEGLQSASTDDLDENQKRWLVVGIGLQSVVAPVLRETISPAVQHLYDTLVKSCHIDTQMFPNYLKKHPATNKYDLNYQSINNNKPVKGPSRNIASYDYNVHDSVELSKLFLATNMALYTGFDETCDTSALLGILEKIDTFDPATRQAAEQTRINVRNSWAHCNFQEWDEAKYDYSFKILNSLIGSLKLPKDKETETTEKLDDLKTHGMKNIWGTKLAAKIQKLAAHIINIASKSKDNLSVMTTELDKIYKYITEMRAIIKDLQDRVQHLESEKAERPKRIFLAPSQKETFTGRKEYLDKIEDSLFKVEPGKIYKVTLCGLGGMGKTTIATEYCWKKRSSYPGGVFWLSGETRESFENYIRRTAASICVSGTNFHEIYAKTLDWFSNVRERCLIIVDNVDEDDITGSRLEFIHNTIMSDCLRHMVITSRRKPIDAQEMFICKACIEVDKLSIDDSMALMKQRIEIDKLSIDDSMALMKQRTSIRDVNQDADIKELCILLDGIPLALEQAAFTIKSLECSFSSYLAEYRKENVAMLKDNIVPLGGTTEDVTRLSINTTWGINLKQIGLKCQVHGFQSEVQLMLDIISCLAGHDIPLEIFNVGDPPVEYGNLCQILQSEMKLKRIIQIFTAFSVLKKDGNTLRVHSLVQTVIRNSIAYDIERRNKIVQSATRMIHKVSLLARNQLDSMILVRLRNQCGALLQNTDMWTIDEETTTALKDLREKIVKYELNVLKEKVRKDLKEWLKQLKEKEKSGNLTEMEKKYKKLLEDVLGR